MKMNSTVLVVDGGGRGTALIDAYARSKWVSKILAVPGNDLMKTHTRKSIKTYPKIKTTDVLEILKICKKEKVDLVDVAQDNAVEVGLVSKLNEIGISVVGPTKESGQIEWDKAWSRSFMKRYKIPSPSFKICFSEDEGEKFIKSFKNQKWVIKASGLAEGKGVIVAKNKKEASAAIKEMKNFKNAGKTFLIEQFLDGE